MSSRAILGLASIGGLVVSMALPAFAQTTTNTTTTTPPATTQPTTTTPTTTTTQQNCPPAASTTSTTSASGVPTNPKTNPNGTTVSGTGPSTTSTTTSSTTSANCPSMTPPAPEQNMPATEPMTSTTNYNALTNNPNGSDWLAKFNRPTVRSNNYLGTTTHSVRTRGTMQRCRYVMERGVRTRICK